MRYRALVQTLTQNANIRSLITGINQCQNQPTLNFNFGQNLTPPELKLLVPRLKFLDLQVNFQGGCEHGIYELSYTNLGSKDG